MDEVTITNIVLSCLSFVLALISIVSVCCTIHQNNKMIENSTRPYVVVTSNKTTFGLKTDFYLIIKNYGKTGAIIRGMESDINLANLSFVSGKVPFGSIEGTFIAPNQSYITVLNTDKLNEEKDNFNIKIKYTANKKEYCETYRVNYALYKENQTARTLDNIQIEKTIARTLQDLVEKHF